MLLVLDMFAFFTYLPGLILDHKGPVTLILGSSILNAAGYGILALTANGVVPVWFAFLGFALAGQGSMWSVVASLGLIGRNIVPQEKGKGIGLAMAWFSLSAVVVESVPKTFGGAGFKLNPLPTDSFNTVFLVMGAVMVAVDLAVAFAVASATSKGHSKRAGSAVGLSWNLGLAILMTLGVFVKAYSDTVETVAQWAFVILLIGGVALVILLGLRLGSSDSQQDPESSGGNQLVTDSDATGSTVAEALRDPKYWTVFAIFAMLVSTGLLVSNKLGDFSAKALPHKFDAGSFFVVGNTLARIFFGYFSDALAKKIPRQWFLVFAAWLMVLAYGILWICDGQDVAPVGLSAIGVFIGGFAFGAPWMMVPAIEMHWYGQAKFGKIHGIMMFATWFGLITVRIGNAVFEDLEGVISFCLVFAVVAALAGTVAFLPCWEKKEADEFGTKPLKASST